MISSLIFRIVNTEERVKKGAVCVVDDWMKSLKIFTIAFVLMFTTIAFISINARKILYCERKRKKYILFSSFDYGPYGNITITNQSPTSPF